MQQRKYINKIYYLILNGLFYWNCKIRSPLTLYSILIHVVTLYMAMMIYVVPEIIMPAFNKFEELDPEGREGALKWKI